MELLGFRKVPVHPEILGHKARECMPDIQQAFIKSRSRWRRDWILTGSFISQDGCSSRATTIPMWSPCPAGPLCTKACSWWDSFAPSSEIFRIRTMNRPLPPFTPGLAPTPTPAGREAHPNRFIVHNGEINTIRGNADKMQAREEHYGVVPPEGTAPQGASGGGP